MVIKRGWGQFRSKKYYTITFFSRKATFTYAFQENTVFTFTLLVVKGLNGNSSLRD